MKVLITILFTIVAIVLFAFALHFAQYRKRKSGCCGGTAITADYTGKTCDEYQNKTCICDPNE
jgi:hypothetical protein